MKLSPPTLIMCPRLSLPTLDEHKYREYINNNEEITTRRNESDKSIVYLESPTSVVKKKLHPDPQTNCSKGRTPKHAP